LARAPRPRDPPWGISGRSNVGASSYAGFSFGETRLAGSDAHLLKNILKKVGVVGRRWGNERRVTLAGVRASGAAVETAGGPEVFDAAVAAMLDDARDWRLVETRKSLGMTQEQVAVRMRVSVVRVCQIESDDVSTPSQRPRSETGSRALLQPARRAAPRRVGPRGPQPDASAVGAAARSAAALI
jgi:hypothetical protein